MKSRKVPTCYFWTARPVAPEAFKAEPVADLIFEQTGDLPGDEKSEIDHEETLRCDVASQVCVSFTPGFNQVLRR
jgi:hypothetical protein